MIRAQIYKVVLKYHIIRNICSKRTFSRFDVFILISILYHVVVAIVRESVGNDKSSNDKICFHFSTTPLFQASVITCWITPIGVELMQIVTSNNDV